MRRRTLLTMLTSGVAALPLVGTSDRSDSQAPGAAPLQFPDELLFFSDDEDALLDRLTDMIIPADECSGGAHDAKVSRYIDREIAHSAVPTQDFWRSSLKLVDEQAVSRFGKSFLECDAGSRDSLMAEWARNEKTPKTELEHFFVRLKRATAFAYFTSEIGLLKELGYKGNDVVAEFQGCTDPACKFCSQ